MVQPGDRFEQLGDRTYTLRPTQAEDYFRLMDTLQEIGFTPQQVLHLGAIDQSHDHSRDQTPFYSLLYFTQALAQTAHSVQFTVMTSHTQDVTGQEMIQPNNATLLGLNHVIPQEYPQFGCRSIDLTLPSSDWLIAALTRDLLTPPIDVLVAYRSQQRWAQRFEPIVLPPVTPPQISLRPQGVYLIAGDLIEGLGMLYAEWIAQTEATKLILLGRADLPIAAEWESWLATHAAKDPISQWIQRMQALQTAGVEWVFYPVDLADAAAVTHALDQQPFGAIQGIIHAGVMGDRASCSISDLNPTTVEQQFHHKVNGLLALEQALQAHNPDFFLLHSSLSAIVGGAGFAAYAGANAFMDALATQRQRTQSTPWFSINWDAVEAVVTHSASTGSSLLDLAITPDEAIQVIDRLLAHAIAPQIIVSPLPLQSRIEQSLHPRPRAIAVPDGAEPSTPTRSLTTPYVAPETEIEQAIAELMRDLLGIDAIGIHDNFFELGGHSLMAIQAVAKLRQQFQVDLPMRQFLFESPTIAGIAKVIAENQTSQPNEAELLTLLEQVEAMDADEAARQLTSKTSEV
jgi:acyl carrier protein/acyl transferase domain-containing protein